jgi:peroxiredoxin
VKKKDRLILVLVICIFTAAGIIFGTRKSQDLSVASAKKAGPVETLLASSLNDATGSAQRLAQLKDNVLVVNFWATWCSPCIKEMPELSDLQKQLETTNIRIIGIGIDSATNIEEFASKHKITYPLYVANNEGIELARQFGNQTGGLPFTVLIDSNGQIKKTYLGRLNITTLKHDLGL